jgi:deoxyribodipyrimidine photolyase-related protein
MTSLIIWPNTIYENNPLLNNVTNVYIVEHPVFFTAYNYHKMKLVLHRSTMKHYYDYVQNKYPDLNITYIPFYKYNKFKIKINKNKFTFYNPNEHIITKEYKITGYDSPSFLMSSEDMETYYKLHKNKNQRHVYFYNYHKDIIIEKYPSLGKYLTKNYDEQNRNKFPDNKEIPDLLFKESITNEYILEAIKYVSKYFPNNPGNPNLIYSNVSFKYAKKLFKDFVNNKLIHFGDYQDAVRSDINVGYHSVLSPLINIGLITPEYILLYLSKHLTALPHLYKKNNIEGYLRQIIGWREYCRYMYTYFRNKLTLNKRLGFNTKTLNTNIWYEFNIDKVNIDFLKVMLIKVRDLAYLHHIERLMYVGNFMLIQGINPKHVFNWFQCMFLDSYHVFMYPNVYGMSQHTSNIMMSKMYLCSSNYITKMSNYKRNDYIDNLYRAFVKKLK